MARDTRSEHFGVLDGPRLYTLRDPQSLEGQLFVRFNGEAARVAAAIEGIVESLDADQVDTTQTIWDSLESNATAMRSLADIILWMTAGLRLAAPLCRTHAEREQKSLLEGHG